MEKEEFVPHEAESAVPNWNPLNFHSEIQADQLNCFLNPNWENSMDQSDPFESALSSIVSSPAASNAAGAITGGGNNIAMGEVIGKLGSICNSGAGGVLSPQSYINSTNNSCYSTPLNSPPKLNLSAMDHHQIRGNLPIPSGNPFTTFAPFPADPGFAERAARFSCFGNENYGGGGVNSNFGFNDSELPHRLIPRVESGKLPRVSSNQSLKVAASQIGNLENKKCFADSDKKLGGIYQENAEFGDSREESSISEQIPAGDLSWKDHPTDCNARKRKSIARGKTKETLIPQKPPAKSDTKVVCENEEPFVKRSKSDESSGNEKTKASETNGNSKITAGGNQKQSKDSSKPPEPPKDYIHVRARRGQATDSHSLAERVRREKISERMKFLQDLVPGCNKVTGKAVMLDEIINYVQSLQRQVEFLSMKLATVSPKGEIDMEALLSKEVLQSRESVYRFDSSVYGLQCQQVPSLPSTQFSVNSLNMHLPSMNGIGEAASQVSAFWQDDLQSVVQMGLAQNQPQIFQGSGSTTDQMKIEL